ncbi:ABC transporter permease subunit [Synechococcus sp. PCC 6312]|uniref:ABC transporter permease subunit n=1 Tax=Synechococcus sp. (strain ATCC 27167 / PCC 6312) TaxID=195253 RepID=UPI001C112499|nr:ABC transporter permease subunit [Synechococcus sp. PCC 6312]
MEYPAVFQAWPRLVLSGILIIFLAISSCTRNDQSLSKVLQVGLEPTFAPFEFQPGGGEVVGFDVDLMRAVGQAVGLAVEFKTMNFDGLIPALAVGQIQAAASGITITADRLEVVDFSRPYFEATLAIGVLPANRNLKTFKDLAGKRIAVQIGTASADEAKKIPNANVIIYDSTDLSIQSLISKNVDAIINDTPTLLYSIARGGFSQIQVFRQEETRQYYGVATQQQSPYLKLINQGLDKILKDGTYDKIYTQWFESPAPALPALAPAQQEMVSTQSGLWDSLKIALRSVPALLQGTVITLQLTTASIVLGIAGGLVLALVRLSQNKWGLGLSAIYIDFFRGTPLLVQIFMIYFGIPGIVQGLGLDFSPDRFVASVAALSLNEAAYMAEILRSGLQAVEKGQQEAAESLGFSGWQTLRHVVFPQAFRQMVPALGNEFISMLKNTSLVAVIGYEELFRKGQLIVADEYRPFEIYTTVAIIYLIMTVIAARGFDYLEYRLYPDKQPHKIITSVK